MPFWRKLDEDFDEDRFLPFALVIEPIDHCDRLILLPYELDRLLLDAIAIIIVTIAF